MAAIRVPLLSLSLLKSHLPTARALSIIATNTTMNRPRQYPNTTVPVGAENWRDPRYVSLGSGAENNMNTNIVKHSTAMLRSFLQNRLLIHGLHAPHPRLQEPRSKIRWLAVRSDSRKWD